MLMEQVGYILKEYLDISYVALSLYGLSCTSCVVMCFLANYYLIVLNSRILLIIVKICYYTYSTPVSV